jgi:hypothetical protein
MQIRRVSKHKGVGDTVEAVLKTLYADKIAEAIAKGVGADDKVVGLEKAKTNRARGGGKKK